MYTNSTLANFDVDGLIYLIIDFDFSVIFAINRKNMTLLINLISQSGCAFPQLFHTLLFRELHSFGTALLLKESSYKLSYERIVDECCDYYFFPACSLRVALLIYTQFISLSCQHPSTSMFYIKTNKEKKGKKKYINKVAS